MQEEYFNFNFKELSQIVRAINMITVFDTLPITVEPRFTGLLGGKGSGLVFGGVGLGAVNRIVKYTNLHINRAFGKGERSR